MTLYLTPGDTQAGNFVHFYYLKRIQDAGAYTNEADVVNRFVLSFPLFYQEYSFDSLFVSYLQVIHLARYF